MNTLEKTTFAEPSRCFQKKPLVDHKVSGGGKASTVSEPERNRQWTMCLYETEISQAVDNPEEALSLIASGNPRRRCPRLLLVSSLGWWGWSIDTQVFKLCLENQPFSQSRSSEIPVEQVRDTAYWEHIIIKTVQVADIMSWRERRRWEEKKKEQTTRNDGKEILNSMMCVRGSLLVSPHERDWPV